MSPPLSSDRGLERVEQFCDLASEFDVDNDCGFHLHIDVSHLDVVTIRRIAIAYKLTESLWHSFVPEGRRNNHYCRPIPWTIGDMKKVDERVQIRQLGSIPLVEFGFDR